MTNVMTSIELLRQNTPINYYILILGYIIIVTTIIALPFGLYRAFHEITIHDGIGTAPQKFVKYCFDEACGGYVFIFTFYMLIPIFVFAWLILIIKNILFYYNVDKPLQKSK